MAELLLINPRKRGGRKAKKAKRKTRRVRRNPVSMRAVTRRAAPAAAKRNPRRRRAVRARRRNPSLRIGGVFSGLVPMVKTALVGAAGAVAVDLAMGQVNKYLPDAVKVQPGKVGAGDAVKAVLTVALGKLLSRPTKGMSVQMAQGALTVQAHGIVKSFLPVSITSQLAYASPARIVPGSNRVGPNTVGAYTRPGATPLLNAYTKPGSASPLLNGARKREGVTVR